MRYIIYICCTAAILVAGCATKSAFQQQAVMHKPNAGFVSDAQTAQDIARFVLKQTLTPEDDRRFNSSATLKDGVWTVRCYGVPSRIRAEAEDIVIQIRQKTGAIIRYDDPDA
jgi:hypothetical protein